MEEKQGTRRPWCFLCRPSGFVFPEGRVGVGPNPEEWELHILIVSQYTGHQNTATISSSFCLKIIYCRVGWPWVHWIFRFNP